MPAEWEPHVATWMAWPHERSDWPGKIAAIPWVYGEVVRQLVPGERVRILVQSTGHERQAQRILARVGANLAYVDFYRVPTDRSWTRDFCPTWVRRPNGSVAIVNWRFNGWAKYPNWKHDNAVPDRLTRALRQRQWKPTIRLERKEHQVVLEGGSLDVNGRGTLLTTEECLLSPVQARNPGMTRAAIEKTLADYLGLTKVIWLGNGIAGDDTHGHVDDLARFVDPHAVVVASEPNPADVNHEPLAENYARLCAASDQDGQPLRVIRLPMPAPLMFDGGRLPASYANFYIGNTVVLVPTFNDPADRIALAILAECFPSRRVVGVHAVDLVWGFGTLHCMTQQQPA